MREEQQSGLSMLMDAELRGSAGYELRQRLVAIRRGIAKLTGQPLGDIAVFMVPPGTSGPLLTHGYYGGKIWRGPASDPADIEFASLVLCKKLPSDSYIIDKIGTDLAAKIAAGVPTTMAEIDAILTGEPE